MDKFVLGKDIPQFADVTAREVTVPSAVQPAKAEQKKRSAKKP